MDAADILGIDPDAPWVVSVTIATAQEVTDEILDALADACDPLDITVARRAGGPGIVFTGDVRGSGGLSTFWGQFAQAIGEVGLGRRESAWLIDMRVSTPNVYEAEAVRPDTPELMAAADVAALLRISRQRVHQLRREHPDFPAPYQELGSGPVWVRPAIENFERIWQRKPGRPSRSVARRVSDIDRTWAEAVRQS